MNPIDEILARAMKSASDTARSDENSKDVKDNVVASVDETNSSDAHGQVDKENTVVLTGAEATTDEKEDGLPKETNDGDAFKEASASELAGIAADLVASITKAAADALNVEAPENGGTTENSPDADGEEEDVSDNGTEAVTSSKEAGLPDAMEGEEDISSDPEPEGDTVATDAAGEEEKKAFNELEAFLALREKFASIEELLGGADQQAGQDAGNVAEFLAAFQGGPGIEEAAAGDVAPEETAEVNEEVPEMAPEMAPEEAPVEGGEEVGAMDELVQVLEEAGISPEDFTQQVGALGEEKLASEGGNGWTGLSKEAKRALVEEALRKNLSKGDK